jgi:hypothetical protein
MRSALRTRMQHILTAAYGLDTQPPNGVLDGGQTLDGSEHFHSLRGNFESRVPAGPTLALALDQWLDQALASQFPAHPKFDDSLTFTRGKVQKVLEVTRRAAETPNGRADVEMNERVTVRQITGPLELGTMHETAWVQSEHWRHIFLKAESAENGPLTVGVMRRAIDQPKPMGLPSLLQDLLLTLRCSQRRMCLVPSGRSSCRRSSLCCHCHWRSRKGKQCLLAMGLLLWRSRQPRLARLPWLLEQQLRG